jgi:hypothetical protein
MMADTLGVATSISGQGSATLNPSGASGAPNSAAPGAAGPAGNMSVARACLLVIGASAAALVGLGIIFRRPIGQT